MAAKSKKGVKEEEALAEAPQPVVEANAESGQATSVEECATPTAESDAADEAVAALDVQKQELQDKMLRMAAEFDNYKKRMVRDREIAFKYAEEGLLKELLPTIDNLERALAHQNDTEDAKGMRDGVELTLKGLLAATAKFGLTPIDSIGQPFDPNLHEALAMEASETLPPQSVVREFEKGYFYKDRLLRAAKVVVSKSGE